MKDLLVYVVLPTVIIAFVIYYLVLLSCNKNDVKHPSIISETVCWYDRTNRIVGHCIKNIGNGCICEHN